MLKQRLDPTRFALDVASPDLLVSEAIAVVEARAPAAVLIGALAGAGHPLHLRYLCKRLRARFPDLPIVVGWWGADGGDEAARDAMVAAGADRVTVSLADACAQLQELALLQPAPEPTAGRDRLSPLTTASPRAAARPPSGRAVPALVSIVTKCANTRDRPPPLARGTRSSTPAWQARARHGVAPTTP